VPQHQEAQDGRAQVGEDEVDQLEPARRVGHERVRPARALREVGVPARHIHLEAFELEPVPS